MEGEKRTKVLCCLHLTDRQVSAVKTGCGYLLVVNAGVLFTLANVIQKIVAPKLVFWHLLAYRALAQIVVMFADLQFKNVDWRGPEGHRTRITIQGMMGGVLLLSIFVAIKHIPLGNASAIFFCTPVFTFLFAVTMLKEHMGAYRIVISALMISGVLLITRPPFLFEADPVSNDGGAGDKSEDGGMVALGYACAVAVPLLSAVVSIMTRQLKDLRPSVIMLWFGIGSLVVSFGGANPM